MKYRRQLLACILLITTLVSCTVDSVEETPQNEQVSNVDVLLGTWNLVRSSTFEGVNLEYPTGVVTYTFQENNVLIVENNAVETTDALPKPSGKLRTGTFSYTFTENNGITFLSVTNEQGAQSVIGSIVLNLNQTLTIDQTALTTGTQFDDYALNFEK
ncbi:hypothetical protein [Kordia jejudonensis]|uniref:hypothetical protein n=1 Tax=Kordia jejudonensis TaxID=1348245 RepID=UPI000629171D|nr:hypothetical protein [Kordia jejudonensis]